MVDFPPFFGLTVAKFKLNSRESFAHYSSTFRVLNRYHILKPKRFHLIRPPLYMTILDPNMGPKSCSRVTLNLLGHPGKSYGTPIAFWCKIMAKGAKSGCKIWRMVQNTFCQILHPDFAPFTIILHQDAIREPWLFPGCPKMFRLILEQLLGSIWGSKVVI